MDLGMLNLGRKPSDRRKAVAEKTSPATQTKKPSTKRPSKDGNSLLAKLMTTTKLKKTHRKKPNTTPPASPTLSPPPNPNSFPPSSSSSASVKTDRSPSLASFAPTILRTPSSLWRNVETVSLLSHGLPNDLPATLARLRYSESAARPDETEAGVGEGGRSRSMPGVNESREALLLVPLEPVPPIPPSLLLMKKSQDLPVEPSPHHRKFPLTPPVEDVPSKSTDVSDAVSEMTARPRPSVDEEEKKAERRRSLISSIVRARVVPSDPGLAARMAVKPTPEEEDLQSEVGAEPWVIAPSTPVVESGEAVMEFASGEENGECRSGVGVSETTGEAGSGVYSSPRASQSLGNGLSESVPTPLVEMWKRALSSIASNDGTSSHENDNKEEAHDNDNKARASPIFPPLSKAKPFTTTQTPTQSPPRSRFPSTSTQSSNFLLPSLTIPTRSSSVDSPSRHVSIYQPVPLRLIDPLDPLTPFTPEMLLGYLGAATPPRSCGGSPARGRWTLPRGAREEGVEWGGGELRACEVKMEVVRSESALPEAVNVTNAPSMTPVLEPPIDHQAAVGDSLTRSDSIPVAPVDGTMSETSVVESPTTPTAAITTTTTPTTTSITTPLTDSSPPRTTAPLVRQASPIASGISWIRGRNAGEASPGTAKRWGGAKTSEKGEGEVKVGSRWSAGRKTRDGKMVVVTSSGDGDTGVPSLLASPPAPQAAEGSVTATTMMEAHVPAVAAEAVGSGGVGEKEGEAFVEEGRVESHITLDDHASQKVKGEALTMDLSAASPTMSTPAKKRPGLFRRWSWSKTSTTKDTGETDAVRKEGDVAGGKKAVGFFGKKTGENGGATRGWRSKSVSYRDVGVRESEKKEGEERKGGFVVEVVAGDGTVPSGVEVVKGVGADGKTAQDPPQAELNDPATSPTAVASMNEVGSARQRSRPGVTVSSGGVIGVGIGRSYRGKRDPKTDSTVPKVVVVDDQGPRPSLECGSAGSLSSVRGCFAKSDTSEDVGRDAAVTPSTASSDETSAQVAPAPLTGGKLSPPPPAVGTIRAVASSASLSSTNTAFVDDDLITAVPFSRRASDPQLFRHSKETEGRSPRVAPKSRKSSLPPSVQNSRGVSSAVSVMSMRAPSVASTASAGGAGQRPFLHGLQPPKRIVGVSGVARKSPGPNSIVSVAGGGGAGKKVVGRKGGVVVGVPAVVRSGMGTVEKPCSPLGTGKGAADSGKRAVGR
ncbi:hypothetical protein HDU67_001437 [Dinochytrium kinnereticum]|nr:hypothetical protein HDU67_001437 [Dinochytrium kinnereticum]